jgi:aspartate/methionine/tyrosine aminotransferase
MDNVDVQPENVLIGPGSKELLFLLQIVFYGEIVVPTPCWVSYEPQAKITGRKIIFLPTIYENRWRITAESFAKFCESECDMYRPRLLVLNYPGNPDGLTYSSDELEEKILSLRSLDYFPYVIKDSDGKSRIFVGAFITREGAERQNRGLKSDNVESRVVKR